MIYSLLLAKKTPHFWSVFFIIVTSYLLVNNFKRINQLGFEMKVNYCFPDGLISVDICLVTL